MRTNPSDDAALEQWGNGATWLEGWSKREAASKHTVSLAHMIGIVERDIRKACVRPQQHDGKIDIVLAIDTVGPGDAELHLPILHEREDGHDVVKGKLPTCNACLRPGERTRSALRISLHLGLFDDVLASYHESPEINVHSRTKGS